MTFKTFFKYRFVVYVLVIGFAAFAVVWLLNNATRPADEGNFGGPILGLTPEQNRKFFLAKTFFEKKFTPQEGLGPLFNERSCAACHGDPDEVGGEGRDLSSTSIMNFARRVPNSEAAKKPLKEVIATLGKRDVDFFLTQGGPSLQRRSVTTEFPDLYPSEVQIDFEQIPIDAELQSNRHAQIIWGAGLIDNIADGDIINNSLKEVQEHPDLAGRPISAIDRFTELPRAARFGWKCQQISLLSFSAQAMNIEMGITSYLQHTENTPTYLGQLPSKALRVLPPTPNDNGKTLLALAYFQSTLAPPPRGKITEQVKHGDEIFRQLRCDVCHLPDAKTVSTVRLPDPESPLPKIRYIECEALSNKVFHPYSDFLVHQMGPDLADGMPQEGARGGEWRSAPLWGLGRRRYFMHDGRAKTIDQAIEMHGGQAAPVRDDWSKLSKEDNDALLAFLKSL